MPVLDNQPRMIKQKGAPATTKRRIDRESMNADTSIGPTPFRYASRL
jgi:hypothetical protein